jgi:hypothetical protein
MRVIGYIAAMALVVATGPAAAATAEVNFVDPDGYADPGGKGGLRDVPTRETVFREIRAHLSDLAQRNLPADQLLKIDVVEIDIAGRREILRTGGEDVRIYDDISPPKIVLRFTLSAGGRVVDSGEERLSNPTYLNTLGRASSGDPIRYERPMLTKWFMARFGKP